MLPFVLLISVGVDHRAGHASAVNAIAAVFRAVGGLTCCCAR